MAELTHRERLQPSLLDRLEDLRPEETTEPSERRFLTLRDLRRAVIRDLQWLFNANNYASSNVLDGYPEIERSVVNYGVRDTSGVMLSSVDLMQLERNLKQAILDFEPRILRRSLSVKAQVEADSMSNDAVTFEIRGELWGQPAPLHMYLRTVLDLVSGHVSVKDAG